MDAAPQVRDMRVKAMSGPRPPPQASAFCTSRGRGPALGLHGRALGPKLPLGPWRAAAPGGAAVFHRVGPGGIFPLSSTARRVWEPESGASL